MVRPSPLWYRGTASDCSHLQRIKANEADLLNDRKEISILEDSLGAMQLTGALEHHVTTTDSILNHIALAATFRRTTSTLKNDTSSRTHSICRFRIEFPPSTKLTFAQDGVLYLIDLAGSEAARDRSEHSSDTMKDSKDINVSLSALKDCIRTKAEWDIQSGSGVGGSGGGGKLAPPHIPFRQNRLTKILKHLFDPNEERTAKTVVMACVNPSLIDVNPSKNTLRFAEMLRVPVPKKGLVVEDDGRPMTWQNEKLKAWIAAEVSPSLTAILSTVEKRKVYTRAEDIKGRNTTQNDTNVNSSPATRPSTQRPSPETSPAPN